MKRFITGLTAAVMLTATAVPVSADSISACPLKTPQIVSTAKTCDSVTLRWNRITGASGYKVYKKVGSKYKVCGTVRDGAKVKFKITKLKSGKKYTFKVRAFKKADGKTCFSKYSKAKSLYTCGIHGRTYEGRHFKLNFDKKVWEASGDDDLVKLQSKIGGTASLRLYCFKDETLKKNDTAKTVAQRTADSWNERTGKSHAEMYSADKIDGVDAYKIHIRFDDDTKYHLMEYYIAYAVKDGYLYCAEGCFNNADTFMLLDCMDEAMRTFRFI